ncbi:MAG: glycosyltransferase family 2 protein [Spirochaetota bacterium]
MAPKQKLVSIALATFNGEKFLREQLDSIYDQTYKNIEIIVSDDCSSDETVEILNEYSKKFGLKYHINNKNIGFVKNFEAAILKCKGEYIALADQDDIWMPDKIERLVSEIEDYSLICSDAELIDDNGNRIAESFQRYSRNYIADGKEFAILVFRNFVTGCTALVTKDLIKRALPIPNGIHHHDWWLALIASKTNGIKYMKAPLIKYRQHQNNDTGANKKINTIQKINEFNLKKDKGKFRNEVINLEAMMASDSFSKDEKVIINNRLIFYKNILNSKLHFKAFIIAFKYRNYMLAGRSLLYKIFFIIGSLIKN